MRNLKVWSGAGLVLLCLAFASQSKADSITLTLTGAGPTGIVEASGTALPAAQQSGVWTYAGVLDWKDAATSAPVYTYCIDIVHDIAGGQTHTFDISPTDLSVSNPSTLFSAAVVRAINNLWRDHSSGLGAPGLLDSTAHVTAISNDDAATFQIALWEVIYDFQNNNTGTLLSPLPLSFSNLTAGDAGLAQTWATAAYTDAGTANVGLEALVATDGSQNQAIFLQAAGAPPLPAPLSVIGGVMLLGLIGTAKWVRRRRRIV
jgi:hypothetical protein